LLKFVGGKCYPQHKCLRKSRTDEAIHEQTHESHKRKRDDQLIKKSLNGSTKSMSQLSISQATVLKKTKLSPVETIPSNNEIIVLKQIRKIIRCIKHRNIWKCHEDYFCIHHICSWIVLWRKTKNNASYYHDLKYLINSFVWNKFVTYIRPISISVYKSKCDPWVLLQIIQSNEPNIIQKYLADYFLLLQNKIDQFTAALMAQSSTCSSTLPSLEIIDQKLKV
jgi:hypothetical protein